MHVVHLTASTFFGGPERQMLGLGESLPRGYRSSYASFSEGGRCREFLSEASRRGFETLELMSDSPPFRDCIHELCTYLKAQQAAVLVTHTFKPNVLGRIAARRVGIPVVAVSRGWTWENLKVRLYETIDRVNLRFVDRVVAVSDGQAQRVRQAGVPSSRLTIIRNAARLAAFAGTNPDCRNRLRNYFPSDLPISHIILAAGRLSPEKGFGVLLNAMTEVLKVHSQAGLVVFGEGTERSLLEGQIRQLGLGQRVRLPGFTQELDSLFAGSDVVVLPSFTEGLPNVALEASAAGVPVVATAVGGTPEVVADGKTGFLVPSGQPGELAQPLNRLLGDASLRSQLGAAGRQRMEQEFTFAAQANKYANLFETLVRHARSRSV
jgi:glycosyltransferase involved in cell wall biosynthesis